MENEKALSRDRGAFRRLAPIFYLMLGAILAFIVFFVIIRPFNVPIVPGSTAAEKEFSSAKDGFAIRYPIDWNALSPSESAKDSGAFAIALQRLNPNAFFSIKVQSINSNGVSLEKLAQTLDKRIASQFPESKKIDQSTISLNSGRKALRYEYSYKAANNARMREHLVIVPAGQKVYHLSMSAADTAFDGIRPEVDSLIENFEVK